MNLHAVFLCNLISPLLCKALHHSDILKSIFNKVTNTLPRLFSFMISITILSISKAESLKVNPTRVHIRLVIKIQMPDFYLRESLGAIEKLNF